MEAVVGFLGALCLITIYDLFEQRRQYRKLFDEVVEQRNFVGKQDDTISYLKMEISRLHEAYSTLYTEFEKIINEQSNSTEKPVG